MKNIFKTIGLLAITSLIFTSCNDEDENTGQSMLDFTPVAVQFSTPQSSYSFSERSIDPADAATNTFTITATVAEAQPVDAIFDFVVSGNNDHDFDFDSNQRITIPAGATSASKLVTINQNGNIEGQEDFVISVKSLGNFTADFSLPLTIHEDYINDNLNVSATWAGTYTYQVTGGTDVTVDFCALDIDVLLFTGANAFVGYVAGTAACTESGVLSGLADGTYKIALDLYENPISVFNTNQAVPVTITYGQEFFIENTTFTYDGYNSNDTSGTVFVAEVEVKNGYEYTVTPL